MNPSEIKKELATLIAMHLFGGHHTTRKPKRAPIGCRPPRPTHEDVFGEFNHDPDDPIPLVTPPHAAEFDPTEDIMRMLRDSEPVRQHPLQIDHEKAGQLLKHSISTSQIRADVRDGCQLPTNVLVVPRNCAVREIVGDDIFDNGSWFNVTECGQSIFVTVGEEV